MACNKLAAALATGLAAVALSGCAAFAPPEKKTAAVQINEDPYPSTYARYPGVPTLIRNATIFDGVGGQLQGDVLIADGVVKAVAQNLAVSDGAQVIDGTGKFVTPGIIDVHSHLGDYPSPGVDSLSDGNEATSPVRPFPPFRLLPGKRSSFPPAHCRRPCPSRCSG